MTVRDRSKVKMPPCPQCGAPTATAWVDVRDFLSRAPGWMPGKMWCVRNEDHDVYTIPAGWAVESDEEQDWFMADDIQQAALEGWMGNPLRATLTQVIPNAVWTRLDCGGGLVLQRSGGNVLAEFFGDGTVRLPPVSGGWMFRAEPTS